MKLAERLSRLGTAPSARIIPRIELPWLNYGDAHAMKRFALALAIVVSLAGPSMAGFVEGLAAYERGDYETALRELKPFAAARANR